MLHALYVAQVHNGSREHLLHALCVNQATLFWQSNCKAYTSGYKQLACVQTLLDFSVLMRLAIPTELRAYYVAQGLNNCWRLLPGQNSNPCCMQGVELGKFQNNSNLPTQPLLMLLLLLPTAASSARAPD